MTPEDHVKEAIRSGFFRNGHLTLIDGPRAQAFLEADLNEAVNAVLELQLAAKDRRIAELEAVISLSKDADVLAAQSQQIAQLQAQVGEVVNIINWLLGENGEFPPKPEPLAGKYHQNFWWRTELRKRAKHALGGKKEG